MSSESTRLKGTEFYISRIFAANAWYECPKDELGRRLGPLVGYAGRDDQGRQKVGDIYVNFAQVEQDPIDRRLFAMKLAIGILDTFGPIDWVIGPEWGGILLATETSGLLGCKTVVAQKKVLEVAKSGGRDKTELIIDRHRIESGTQGVCIEDVTNNLSTPGQVEPLIAARGAELIGLASAVNRSENAWWSVGERKREIVSAVFRPLPQYVQDHPDVKADIGAGNVVLKPKSQDGWQRLMEAMDAAK